MAFAPTLKMEHQSGALRLRRFFSSQLLSSIIGATHRLCEQQTSSRKPMLKDALKSLAKVAMCKSKFEQQATANPNLGRIGDTAP